MKHYFVQHGKAVTKEIDESRPLSEEGIDETRALAKHLAKKNIKLSHIYHSGKKRASQTAEIFAEELGLTKVSSAEGLNPNDDVRSFSDGQLSCDTTDTMYIGHLPHLNKLVSYLLCNDETANCVIFQNSAVVCIGRTDNGASLLSYITPATI